MEIAVKFKNRDHIIYYTSAILHLLRTDPEVEYIINPDNGEILFKAE